MGRTGFVPVTSSVSGKEGQQVMTNFYALTCEFTSTSLQHTPLGHRLLAHQWRMADCVRKVRVARAFVAAALGESHPNFDVAFLLASEPVSNSVRHSGSVVSRVASWW